MNRNYRGYTSDFHISDYISLRRLEIQLTAISIDIGNLVADAR